MTLRNLTTLAVPAVYLVIEFSFNHRLMTLTAYMVDDSVLLGLEFWGRLLSGIGLGLLMFRWSRNRLGMNQSGLLTLTRLALSLLLGIVLMWNVQQSITSHWVDSATAEDKQVAWVLGSLGPRAAEGKLTTLQGDALLQRKPNQPERQLLASLFAAASLHTERRLEQIAAWAGAGEVGELLKWQASLAPEQLDNAFRNLIIPPLTLGFSLFFALFNLAQLSASLLPRMSEARRRWAAGLLLALLVALSVHHDSPFLDSPGYQRSMQPNLWAADKSLGLLTEWSFRSVALWQPLSAWLHEHPLQGFDFNRPFLAP